ncbi:hypothetical protein D0Z70_08260 [Sphingobium terrigena]|uniref:Uncharacterized protein n=1 Tax=Sphingobium terrigena TaxID=2304063 RepID=A0A418YTM5_9SPHN|nr:hypothetical protein [Sphingobium terrigena]RJG55393.1 hypothetical protein D0Z70_08260 [Sphingobium terrigena]
MKQPSLKTRIIGSPPVVLPTVGFFLWSGYMLLTQGDEMWPMAITATLLVTWVMRAHEQRDAYLTWKRAWNAMAGQTPQQRKIAKPITGIVGIIMVSLYLVATLDRTDTQTALGLSVVGIIGACAIFAGRSLWRRLRRRRAAKAAFVTVCIRSPLLPVPTLQQAYAALPAHCWVVLGGR